MFDGFDALARVRGAINLLKARFKGGWREEDHPRAEDGRFGDKPGGGAATATLDEFVFHDAAEAKEALPARLAELRARLKREGPA